MEKEVDTSKEKKLDFLISIAKDEYDVFFKRNQILDAKVAIIITIMGAICSFTVDIDYLNNLVHNLTIYNYSELLLYIVLIGIFIAIIVLTTGIIIPKDTSFMPLSIFDKKVCDSEDFVKVKSRILLESYKKILENNDKVLCKKNRKFSVITVLSIIEIAIVIVLQTFKIFL